MTSSLIIIPLLIIVIGICIAVIFNTIKRAHAAELSEASTKVYAESLAKQLEDEKSAHREDVEKTQKDAADILSRQLDTQKAANDNLLTTLKEQHAREIQTLKDEHAQRLAAEQAHLDEKFKSLASEALRANSEQFGSQNSIRMEAILAPIRERLEQFTKDFTSRYGQESQDRNLLLQEIKNLKELNQAVSKEASRLTTALKGDTRIQGQWGEMVLKNILQRSGLEEGREFILQEARQGADGQSYRPDAVIHCPDNRCIIIDSKVSINAYTKWLECPENEKERYAAEHVQAIDNHIRILSSKEYQSTFRKSVDDEASADFVLMFIAHEGAYILAMQTRPDLWQKAYDKHIIIVPPTHLITLMTLVNQMWRVFKQDANAKKIADEAGEILNKLTNSINQFAEVSEVLDKAQKKLQDSMARLTSGKGNVIKRIENLKDLGVKVSANLQEDKINKLLDHSPLLPD